MTINEALKRAEAQLACANIDDAAVDAWILLEYVSGMNRTRFLMERNSPMETEQLQRYQNLIAQRCTHIPLQHLTGEQDFMGLTFHVNEHVLIPRQDTEILVEKALGYLLPGMHVLDLCTGSGCIAVSLAVLGNERLGRDSVTVDAADLSEQALLVAAENVQRLGANVQLIHSDLFEQIQDSYDMIVSNPPYIPTSVIEGLSEEVRLHEPYMALDGTEDGLYFYRQIVEQSRNYLKSGGYLLFEIGHDQGMSVSELLNNAGYEEVTIWKDLAGLDRVVFGKRK